MLVSVRTQLEMPNRSTPDLERIGLERERGEHHVAAVAAADDADPGRVHVAGADQHPLARDDVAQIGLAVLPVVHREEGLAVAGAAAVVDVEDHVAVVHQRLRQGEVADLRLAARPAVHQHDRRRLRVRRRLVRSIEQARDLEAVVRLEAHHRWHHQVLAPDVRVQGVGQPPRGLRPAYRRTGRPGRCRRSRRMRSRTRRARARCLAPGRAASPAARPASAWPASSRRASESGVLVHADDQILPALGVAGAEDVPGLLVHGGPPAAWRCRETGARRTPDRCRR